MTEGKRNIIRQLLEEYDIETAGDIQEALKDLLGGTIKEMMEAEMDDHLGYQKSERSNNDDYRNGYKEKRINSSYVPMTISVPQGRKSTFEEACRTALSYTQSPSCKSVSNILAASKDSEPESTDNDPDTPKSNTNGITRGADYYRRK